MSEPDAPVKLRGELTGGRLSDRERDLLQALADGETVEQFADRTLRSPKTKYTVLARIREKLEARTKTHAVAIAIRRGMIG